MKRDIIAALLRSGRPDLANAVAYRVTGALVLPPRKIGPFVTKLAKRMRKLDVQAANLDRYFKNLDRTYRDKTGYEYNPIEDFVVEYADGYRARGADTFTYALEALEPEYGASDRLLQYYARDFDHLWKMLQGMESAHDQLQYVGYLADAARRAAEKLKRFTEMKAKELVKQRDWIKPSWDDYVRNGYTDPDFTVHVERKQLVAFDKLVQDIVTLQRDLEDAAVRLTHAKSSAWERYNDPQWQPESEETETLYHASIDAKTIFRRKAFDEKVPEAKGLGGAQGDRKGKPAISFTSDLYVAKEIMRTLKEAIMVSRGEVTAAQLYDWARRGGIYDDVSRNFKSLYGEFDPKKPVHTFNLYRLYLTFHKTRYNPVFFGDMDRLVKTFKKAKVSDVGVLVCSVNMKHPDNAYLASMHEYRVPPSAVVSVDKLIR